MEHCVACRLIPDANASHCNHILCLGARGGVNRALTNKPDRETTGSERILQRLLLSNAAIDA